MNNKVSIIIPVYNGEKYISRMLNCIKDQTYQNIQVIIAYDTKSTDKTLEILKSFRAVSPYNFIIDEGCDTSIGEARNRGYKLATGDFVIFIDADDYILPTTIENLAMGLIQNQNINISSERYWVINHENRLLKTIDILKRRNSKKTINYKTVSTKTIFNNIWKNHKYANTAWNYMIRKSFLDFHHIVFPDFSHGEDQLFVLNCLTYSNDILVSNHYGYIYIRHENSVSHQNMKSPDEYLHQHLDFISEYNKLASESFPTIKMNFDLQCILLNLFYNSNLPLNMFLKNIDEKKIYKIPYSTVINRKQKIAVIGFNINPKIFYLGVKLFNHLRNLNWRNTNVYN